VAEVELLGDGGDARILLAAPLTRDELDAAVEPTVVTVAEWDRRARDVRVQRETRIGAIVLKASPVDDPTAAGLALVDGVRVEGLTLLPRLDDASALRSRIAFCRRHLGDEWPDLGDDALLVRLDEWLLPALTSARARRRSDLTRVDVVGALRHLVPWSQLARLDDLAPTHVTTAKGSRRGVDYTGDDPSVALRIQDAFGWYETPKLAGGRVPLVVSLLSPANRPVQVTRDLAGFWRGSYKEVRAELRGRYPKHAWPEDPTKP
jgi:ATP-dependent helicase HrpB